MPAPRALLVLTAALPGLGLVACSASGPDTSAPTGSAAAPTPTVAGLPFHYEALGESSSPTFHVDKDGSYTVAYTLKGSTDQPGCIVSIAMVGEDGSSHQIVSAQKLQPADSKQDTVPATLTPGAWRFQEGGGCAWSVTVSASG